ncbi:MAG: hypothetical protein HN683_03195 [Gammaproteobacteria bacterium]|jgi:hypothetical protein|nr:hypothetical protein [Gammaproteobacteria bacterium]
MDLIVGLMAKAPDYLVAISGIIASLTVLTAITPTQLDDKWLGKATVGVNFLLKLANIGAGNIGKNKNQDEEEARIKGKVK